TPSSSATPASVSVSGNEEMKPTPKGRAGSDRAMRICLRNHDAPSGFVPPIMPKPPASETAAASAPVAVPAIEALRIGYSMPSNVQIGVVIMNGLPFLSLLPANELSSWQERTAAVLTFLV